jgi:hypothetical protein
MSKAATPSMAFSKAGERDMGPVLGTARPLGECCVHILEQWPAPRWRAAQLNRHRLPDECVIDPARAIRATRPLWK